MTVILTGNGISAHGVLPTLDGVDVVHKIHASHNDAVTMSDAVYFLHGLRPPLSRALDSHYYNRVTHSARLRTGRVLKLGGADSMLYARNRDHPSL